MKKVVSILLAMIILCSLFTGCATNTPEDDSPQNNSTSDTSPAGNSTTTNDTKTYRMALIQPQNNLDYFNFITASAQKYADANGIELTVWQQNSDQAMPLSLTAFSSSALGIFFPSASSSSISISACAVLLSALAVSVPASSSSAVMS